MRYTLAGLMEDKKLRKVMAEQANEKELDFEDGNGIFALDFRGQSLYINHRRTYDTLCELGGEKLLKKLMKEEKTCIIEAAKEDRKGVSPIHGTEKYCLLTNAGPTKVFTSILQGIAAWAKMDKSFDASLVHFDCAGDAVEAVEEDEPDSFDVLNFDTEDGWLCQGHAYSNFNLNAVQSGVLSEKDGKSIFVDADTGREIYLMEIARRGGMLSCVALYEGDDEGNPIIGYKYRAEAGGKWGFISPRLVRVTPPDYDEITAAGTMVAAWTVVGEETIDLTLSVQAKQKNTGIQDNWLLWHGPVFRKAHSLYTPLSNAVLEEKVLDDDHRAYLYRPGRNMNTGLFQKCSVHEPGKTHTVACKNGFVYGPDFEGRVPAASLTLEKCLQLDEEGSAEVYFSTCVAEPAHQGVGTYIIRKDGYWALADVDVSGEPAIKHLSTPLAYTKMAKPEDWPSRLVLLERFGKKGIYNWMREEFLAACEYEKIFMDKRGHFVLVRHGKERQMDTYGRWLEEAKPACPKCKAELVKGALYCHMCGISLTEPEKKEEPVKPEVKSEPVKEDPKPVEPPKPVAPPKPKIKVPTKHNFSDNYIRTGRLSAVSNGSLTVYTQYDDKPEKNTDPEYHLYGDIRISHYDNKTIGSVVEGLSGLTAFALGEEGIFYAKNDAIWYLTSDGTPRKLGEQKKVIALTDGGNGKLTVEYVVRCDYSHSDYADRDYYEVWYDVYSVNTKKVTLNY